MFPAAFGVLFKNEFTKYESCFNFTMKKHTFEENFRLFCTFSHFLKIFKVEYFASYLDFYDIKLQKPRIFWICTEKPIKAV